MLQLVSLENRPSKTNQISCARMQKKASNGEDSYDSIVELAREIKAAMDRDKKLLEEPKQKVDALTVELHYTKAAQFRQPHLISSAQHKPTKITSLFRRPTQADEI
jgi:hypothetical protein